MPDVAINHQDADLRQMAKPWRRRNDYLAHYVLKPSQKVRFVTIPNSWVVPQSKSHSAAMRLFCFPYAGGGAAYRGWSDLAGSELEVCSVQWPGSQNRLKEAPFASISELVPALVNGILEWLDRPFAFYGHSLGAKIAFETVRELRRRNLAQPSQLFVGASQAPHLRWPHPVLHGLEESAFVAGIQRLYGGVPRQVLEDRELRALLIPSLRADVRLIETYVYVPEEPLSCPITVFGGTSDGTVNPGALDEWKHQTRATGRLQMIEGDHFFLNAARRELLNIILAELPLHPVEVG